jgi:hypothetical protein
MAPGVLRWYQETGLLPSLLSAPVDRSIPDMATHTLGYMDSGLLPENTTGDSPGNEAVCAVVERALGSSTCTRMSVLMAFPW